MMVRWSSSRVMMTGPWKPDIPMEDLIGRWALPPSTFVDVKGLKVHLRDEGPRTDPVPIVLIHGTSSSLQTWEGWVEALKGQRRVITFDLPGFGLTGPNARGDYRLESYVQFVMDLLDTLRVQLCIVAGNSLGGDIAWHLAVAAPPRVQRLILVDAAGYPMPQSKSIYSYIVKMPVLNQLFRFAMSRSALESGLKKLYGDPSRVTRAVVDRHEQMMLCQGNRGALIKAIEQSNIGSAAPMIKTVKQPTLIIWGGRDRLIPPDHAQRFRRDISGSQLEIFDDLGHMPQEEDPERTVEAVLAFLAIKQTDVNIRKEYIKIRKKDLKIKWTDSWLNNKWKTIRSLPAEFIRWINH